jgi:hypothetical protein
MRLIIAGSRDLNPSTEDTFKYLYENKISDIGEIVCGEAKGVDSAGKLFAEQYGIDVMSFPADWNTHGRAAGPIRNMQMADYADMLLLIWDGKSRGSLNMKQNMIKRNKPVYEVII